ncbi:MAG TPA: ABC transporter ATP-binding protein [Myxococcales bacterium]|jgi:ABC-2 type transport system ATP-binding protein|nr:ABC transporter ATP-binding protein [Myxococcales bacterium]
MTAALRCEKLVKKYGDVTAVDGLDLTIERGECFGLLGPNGAGKTTTVEIFEGLNDPSSGSVEVLGLRWATDERALRERIGLSLQETNFPERLTVREVLALFRSFFSKGRTVDEVLDLVSLREKQGTWTEKLSGGQKQRLAVAVGLVGDPELLFLDEPTTGLDPQSRRQLWDIITSFREAQRTVLLTTHYMDEAERLCNRVAVVDKGKIIALGTPRELIESLGGPEIVEVKTSRSGSVQTTQKPGELPALAGVHSSKPITGGYLFTVEQLHIALPEILRVLGPLGIENLSTRRATLEDVFVHLTGRKLRE